MSDRAAYVRAVAASEDPRKLSPEAMEVEVPSRTSFGVGWRTLKEWAENTAGANGRLDRMEHALATTGRFTPPLGFGPGRSIARCSFVR